MASHQLAIAKASLSAGLLKPDPTSLHREEIAHFHSLLERALTQCTAANVQKCKQWILENIIQSTGRFTALGKYLTVLGTSFADAPLRPAAKREPSIRRKRLHILYLINDILYHAKYRAGDASVCGKLQPILVGLLGSAASFTACPKHQHKIVALLDLWEEKDYYAKEYINKLRETVRNAAEAGSHVEGATGEEAGPSTKVSRSAPYVMPAMHGDVSTPWFDLPAGNLMPHIVPNSTRPINPDMIKPLRFVAGPADEALATAVKGLLQDVQKIFDGETDPDGTLSWDIDELGQPIVLDEITGEVIEGEGYYGWSRGFCEKMKRRRNGLDMPGDGGRTSRSRSSSPGGKRRRQSGSDGSGHRASRRRSAYSSRSPSPDGRRGFKSGRSPSPSRSRTYSRSRSPRSPRPADPRSFQPAGGRPEAFPPYPPPPALPPFIPQASFQPGFNPHVPQPPPPPSAAFHHPGPQQQQPYGSWPIPPPPNSPWPPPPPPGPGYFYQQAPPGGFPGGWTASTQHGSGRGYNAGWDLSKGGGRGGGPRGRGWPS